MLTERIMYWKKERIYSLQYKVEKSLLTDVINKIPIEITLQTSQLKQILKKIKLAKSKKILAFEEEDKLWLVSLREK